MKNSSSGHRERLREKYLREGITAFHDYEILELLLTYVIMRKDVKPLAKELLKSYGTLERLINSEMEDLLTTDGVGEKTAVFFKLLGDVSKNIFKEKMKTEDIIELSGKIALLDYLRGDIGFSNIEKFKVLFLNNANKLIGEETLFQGTIDRSSIYPREIIEKVFKYKAKKIIFAHNHPSGNVKPSDGDIDITQHMVEILRMIDVVFLDHIIVSKDKYFSFRDEKLIY